MLTDALARAASRPSEQEDRDLIEKLLSFHQPELHWTTFGDKQHCRQCGGTGWPCHTHKLATIAQRSMGRTDYWRNLAKQHSTTLTEIAEHLDRELQR